jgi:uncharacterized membrane protein
MIKGLWHRIRQDKILFAIFVFVCVAVMFDLFVLVFDIVQFAIVSNNRPALATSFTALNIIAAALNLVAVAVCVLYAIFRKK